MSTYLNLAPSGIERQWYPVKYGLLYNWFATQEQSGGVWLVSDAMRGLNWGVPSKANWETLMYYLDPNYDPDYLGQGYGLSLIAGGKLKESGITYWNSPNTGATNEVEFNLRGLAQRYSSGEFEIVLGEYTGLWSKTEIDSDLAYYLDAYYASTESTLSWDGKKSGLPIRPVRPATLSDPTGDGVSCALYIGNDGKRYRTVRIGDQVWVADNLAETKWSNGNYIQGWDADGRVVISDAAWAALTTAAVCVYGDNIINM